MAEEDNSNVHSSNEEAEDELTSSGTNDFCVLSTDDIRDDDVSPSSKDDRSEITEYRSAEPSTSSVDSLENVKRKAREIADSLQKVRIKSSSSTTDVSQNYELPENLKRHRERSLYVARKLQEDKMLFEESKKRNETVFDKVRLAKRIHQNITENVKELKREDGDESNVLKLKIDRLESTISHLKESLATKNRIISEKNETIRTLNQTVTDVHEAHQHSLEKSAEEMTNIKNEYTKAIEEISNSKNEVHSQLQVMRKKYLILENDLKLSDFARCRLVSRNAELREHINQLENENEKLITKINDNTSLEELAQDHYKSFSDETDLRHVKLKPKIENLAAVTNEFQSLLTDDDIEKDELYVDDDDLSQIVDQIGDRLESCFYAFRDKLASVSKNSHETEKLKDLLAHLSCANNEAKNIEARLQEQITELQSRLITESLQLDDLKSKYEDISVENEQLRVQINEIRDTELTSSKQMIDELQYECHRLQNELKTRTIEKNEAISRLASLQSEYEELRRANESSRLQFEYEKLSKDYENLDGRFQTMSEELATKNREYDLLKSEIEHQSQEEKFENDFVVLPNRDYDEEEATVKRLHQDNEKLMENVRIMSERAVEHENEKLAFSQQYRRLHETVERLQMELETAGKKDDKDDKDEEIEGLQNEMSKLLHELNKVWDQLHDEKSINHELNQQLTYSEEMNGKLSNEMRALREQCRVLRPEIVHELETQNQRLQNELETAASVQRDLDRTKRFLKRLWELVDQSSCQYDSLETVYERVKHALMTGESNLEEIEALKVGINAVIAEKDSLQQEIKILTSSNSELQRTMEHEQDESRKQLMQIRDEFMLQNNSAQFRTEEMAQSLQEQNVKLEQLNVELETARERLRQSEEASSKLVTNCTSEVDSLRGAILELKDENQSLRSKCESYYSKYVDLFAHVNDIVARAKNTSDEAIRIITKLQTRWNSRKDDVGCQYDEQIAAAWANDLYERGRQMQTETYECLLDEMRVELNSLQSQYAFAKEQLLMKDDECNGEIARYEKVLAQLRVQFNEVRDDLDIAKRELTQKEELVDELRQSQHREGIELGVQTSDTEQSNPTAGIVSFFKDRMTKGVAEMLHPEETTDYSQYIFPEANSELVVERPPQQPPAIANIRKESQSAAVREPLAISDTLDKLKALIAGRNNSSGWEVEEEGDWNSSQLEITDDEFVNVAFKFVDLFDVVYKYYSNLPQTEIVLSHFRSIIQPEQQHTSIVTRDHKDTFEQLVNLATYFENENKCLVDVVTFVEDLVVSRSCRMESPRIVNITQDCRRRRGIDESDIVDTICEEYDIVPEKFTPEESLTQWRENVAKLINSSNSYVEKTPVDIEPILKYLEMLRAKIEDISHRVESSVRLMQGKEVKQLDREEDGLHSHDVDHHHDLDDDDDDEHDHHDNDHPDHRHDDDDHHHRHKEELHRHETDNVRQDEANELKSLLAESNKKIGSLVTELMEVKNSKEYNEVIQLHAKLDETLYQLHLRDVHVVELTRELTQLLSERDELQLKLSNIIRQNEQLRESKAHQGTESAKLTELENKLGELHAVDYMKDPRILETSKQYHEAEMHLYNVDPNSANRTRTESGGFSVPSLLKWITGDNETN